MTYAVTSAAMATKGTSKTVKRTCLTFFDTTWPPALSPLVGPGHSLPRKLQRKMNERRFVPIHPSQVKPRTDQPDLIPNPLRHQRRLRIVQNDAFLLIQPARPLVHRSHN